MNTKQTLKAHQDFINALNHRAYLESKDIQAWHQCLLKTSDLLLLPGELEIKHYLQSLN